ncbi:hypothetical protein [Liquorilactobacillus sp.]
MERRRQYCVTKIGTPLVTQKKGKNTLVVSYNIGNWFLPIMYLIIITWISCLTYIVLKLFRRFKK